MQAELDKQNGARSRQHGDEDFRVKLVELIPFLRAFARALCGQRDAADDLCQETLAKAWGARANFEGGTNLTAWLFTIARNQFYSDKRRTWRQAPWNDATAENTLLARPNQDSAVALSETARALSLLPAEQREALILIGPGGLSYDEASKVCGCATGTIKSRVFRARLKLAAMRDGLEPLQGGMRPASAEAADEIVRQIEGLLSTSRRA